MPANNKLVFLMIFHQLISNSFNAYAGDATIKISNIDGLPIANAVVYLEVENPLKSKVDTATTISQKNKTFIPFVSVVQTGTSITFPNKDSVRHHVYSFSPAKKFELKLYSGVPSTPIVFDQPGIVVLGCNIHDNMIAYVYIVDTPYFAKTDADGMAKLINVPDGQYQLKVSHPDSLSEGDLFTQAIVIKDSQVIAVKVNTKS